MDSVFDLLEFTNELNCASPCTCASSVLCVRGGGGGASDSVWGDMNSEPRTHLLVLLAEVRVEGTPHKPRCENIG